MPSDSILFNVQLSTYITDTLSGVLACSDFTIITRDGACVNVTMSSDSLPISVRAVCDDSLLSRAMQHGLFQLDQITLTPSMDRLSLSGRNLEAIRGIHVDDLLGRRVFDLDPHFENGVFNLSLPAIPDGAYWISCEGGGLRIRRKLFIAR
jgi:hypothetical protein